jgi:hypothetical protein
MIAAAIGIAFLATATFLPAALRLPRWLDAEWVFVAWWAVAAAGLALLIYRGARVADDHAIVSWSPLAKEGPMPLPSVGTVADGAFLAADADGCLGVIIGLLLAAVTYVAAVVFVDFAAPLAFLLCYGIVLGASRRVLRAHPKCRGRLAPSIAWGTLWAAAYVVPLMVAVRFLHALLQAAHG